MAVAASSALTKRKSTEDMALMPPPRLPKRIKRPSIVLDEEVYTDALSHIIARDFFPGLLETRAQQEYLDALDSDNNEWIREAGQNLKVVMTTPDPYRRQRSRTAREPSTVERTPASVATTMTPGRTPRKRNTDFDPGLTPSVSGGGGGGGGGGGEVGDQQGKPEVDLTLSLSEFQARYTSEDNESFNKVLDAQNMAKAKKYAFLRNNTNRLPSHQQIAARAEQKLLTAGLDRSRPPTSLTQKTSHTTRDETATSSSTSSSAVTTTTTTTTNPRPSQDLDLRPATLDTFPLRQGAKNSFMFIPDSLEEAGDGSSTTTKMTTPAQASEAASLAGPKTTNHPATRFPGPEPSSRRHPPPPPSPSTSAIDAAIAGRPRRRSRVDNEEEDGYGAGGGGPDSTPMVNGYRFVDADVTPVEAALYGGGGDDDGADGADGMAREREELLRLLRRPNNDDGPGGAGAGAGAGGVVLAGGFRLQGKSKRERLLERMVQRNEAARREREAFGRKGKGAAERGHMTPAARSLAGRLGASLSSSSSPLSSVRRRGREGEGEVMEGGFFGGAFGARRGEEKRVWTPLRTPGLVKR